MEINNFEGVLNRPDSNCSKSSAGLHPRVTSPQPSTSGTSSQSPIVGDWNLDEEDKRDLERDEYGMKILKAKVTFPTALPEFTYTTQALLDAKLKSAMGKVVREVGDFYLRLLGRLTIGDYDAIGRTVIAKYPFLAAKRTGAKAKLGTRTDYVSIFVLQFHYKIFNTSDYKF